MRRLIILVCENYFLEYITAIKNEAPQDVEMQAYSCLCNKNGNASIRHNHVFQVFPKDCEIVLICCMDCDVSKAQVPSNYKVYMNEYDYARLICKPYIQSIRRNKGIIINSSGLLYWHSHLASNRSDGQKSLTEFKKHGDRIVFLDAGVAEDARSMLQKLSDACSMPYEIIQCDLEPMRTFIHSVINDWRIRNHSIKQNMQMDMEGQIAEYAAILNIIETISDARNQKEVIDLIKRVFLYIFGARKCIYWEFSSVGVIPEAAQELVATSDSSYSYSHISKDLFLKLEHSGQLFGVLEVGDYMFPQYSERYLNLAIAIIKLSTPMLSNIKKYEALESVVKHIINGQALNKNTKVETDELPLQSFDILLEDIEQYDKQRTQFFANLSHELRTPINIVFSTVQLLIFYRQYEDEAYEHKVDRHFSVMKQNCYRLMRLINNIIDVTRYQSGFLELNFGLYNIVKIVEDVSLSIVKYAELKGITIVFDTDIEERVISCDPDSIERIMLNLISNAIKFTNTKGTIDIQIQDSPEYIHIAVKDTGVGIPQDKLEAIFEPFRQIDSSLSRLHEGSGIGLSLVKKLVEAHKGVISVKSEIGIGTTFFIDLPAGAYGEVCDDVHRHESSQSIVEKINIEFSDIYYNV